MGFDERILVVRQITDENAWHMAMEEIAREFEDDLADDPTAAGGAWLLSDSCATDEGQRRVRSVLQDFSAMRRFAAAEELNFGVRGLSELDMFYWKSPYFRLEESGALFRLDDVEAVAKKETALSRAPGGSGG